MLGTMRVRQRSAQNQVTVPVVHLLMGRFARARLASSHSFSGSCQGTDLALVRLHLHHSNSGYDVLVGSFLPENKP